MQAVGAVDRVSATESGVVRLAGFGRFPAEGARKRPGPFRIEVALIEEVDESIDFLLRFLDEFLPFTFTEVGRGQAEYSSHGKPVVVALRTPFRIMVQRSFFCSSSSISVIRHSGAEIRQRTLGFIRACRRPSGRNHSRKRQFISVLNGPGSKSRLDAVMSPTPAGLHSPRAGRHVQRPGTGLPQTRAGNRPGPSCNCPRGRGQSGAGNPWK